MVSSLPIYFTDTSIESIFSISNIFLNNSNIVYLGFPFRHMVKMFLILMLLLSSFYFLAKTFPDQFPNRIDTWISRVENFNSTQNLDAVIRLKEQKWQLIMED